MKPIIRSFPNGWTALRYQVGTWYCASVRNARGETHDAIRCDTPRAAREYFQAFAAIAKRAGGQS
jgi:hypothetical protein